MPLQPLCNWRSSNESFWKPNAYYQPLKNYRVNADSLQIASDQVWNFGGDNTSPTSTLITTDFGPLQVGMISDESGQRQLRRNLTRTD